MSSNKDESLYTSSMDEILKHWIGFDDQDEFTRALAAHEQVIRDKQMARDIDIVWAQDASAARWEISAAIRGQIHDQDS